MYAVSFYAVAPGQFDRVREVYPRHRAYLDEFARGGQVVMIGTFADPVADGSMAISEPALPRRNSATATRSCWKDWSVSRGFLTGIRWSSQLSSAAISVAAKTDGLDDKTPLPSPVRMG